MFQVNWSPAIRPCRTQGEAGSAANSLEGGIAPALAAAQRYIAQLYFLRPFVTSAPAPVKGVGISFSPFYFELPRTSRIHAAPLPTLVAFRTACRHQVANFF